MMANGVNSEDISIPQSSFKLLTARIHNSVFKRKHLNKQTNKSIKKCTINTTTQQRPYSSSKNRFNLTNKD